MDHLLFILEVIPLVHIPLDGQVLLSAFYGGGFYAVGCIYVFWESVLSGVISGMLAMF